MTQNTQPEMECARGVCGNKVTHSKNRELYPYCKECHITGLAAEHQRDEQLTRFIEAFPEASSVAVEHTGGGCFWLAVRFEDDPKYYVFTDGDAALPLQNVADLDADPQAEEWVPIPDGGWGYVGRHDDTELTSEQFDAMTPEERAAWYDETNPDYEGTSLFWVLDARDAISDAAAIAIARADLDARREEVTT